MMQEYICPEAEAYVLLTSHIFCLHLTQCITPVHTTSLHYIPILAVCKDTTHTGPSFCQLNIIPWLDIYFQYFSHLLKNKHPLVFLSWQSNGATNENVCYLS